MRRVVTSVVLCLIAGVVTATPAAAEPAAPDSSTTVLLRSGSPEPVPPPRSGTAPVDTVVTSVGEPAEPARTAPEPAPRDWYTPTTHFHRNDDGSVTAEIRGGTAFRRDANGAWHATARALNASADHAWPLAAPTGFRPVRFGRSAERLLQIDLPKGAVTMSADGLDLRAPAGDGRFARYRDVATDTDLRFEPGAGGVKQELVLRSANAPRSFKFHLSDPAGLLGDVERTEDGGYVFSGDIGDGVRLSIPPAVAYEQEPGNAMPIGLPGSAHLTITRAGDGWDIVESVDEEWLSGKSFPVVLDPSLTYSGSAHLDCYVVSDNYSDQGNCNVGALMAGNGQGGEPLGTCGTGTPKWCITRGLIKPDVSSLPKGSNVTAATLRLWQFANRTSETFVAGLYNNNHVFNSAATWDQYDAVCAEPCWSGGSVGSWQDDVSINATDTYRTFNMTGSNIIETWRNNLSNVGGLMIRANPESRTAINTADPGTAGHTVGFYTNTVADSSKWPLLTVTYTPPPAPTVTKTVAAAAGYTLSSNGYFGRNTVAQYTVALQSTVAQEDVTLKDIYPAGLKIFSSTLKLNGGTCSGCSVGATTITSGLLDFTAGQTHTITYQALVTGVDQRGCSNLVNTATATGQGGGSNADPTASDANTAVVCDVGLGVEPWWTFFERQVSGAGTARVNVANGNVVVTHADSTPIQGRGQLAFGLRRTYNSQDARVVALPGGLPKGWQLNFGEVSDALGTSASGLVVPPLSTLSKTLPVVLVDRDGTRHTFEPRATTALKRILRVDNLTNPPAGQLVPEAGVSTALVPKALGAALDLSKYTSVCLDLSYAPPDGVHLGLWRYIAVDDRNTTSCTAATGSVSPKVLGFATMRTDRYRNEFTWDGRLLSQLDSTGNEFRYLYGATLPFAGVATGPLTRVYDASECTEAQALAAGSTCRSYLLTYDTGGNLSTILDPAGRTTTYTYDTSFGFPQLSRVTNHDGTFVEYTYADGDAVTCAAAGQVANRGQLCSIRDERNVVTKLHYSSTLNGKIGPLVSLEDRWGATTTFTYPTTAQTDVLTNGVQKRSFKLIDSVGRVGQVVDSDTTATYHQTDFTWDSAGCRVPTAGADNNLCRVVRKAFNDSQTGVTNFITTPNDDKSFRYNDEGRLLWQTETDGTSTMVTTNGYETVFVQPATTTKVADTVTASGGHTIGSRTASTAVDLLYTLSDHTQSQTPRGNAASSTDFAKYLTTYHVDNNKDVSPNTAPPAPVTGDPRDPVICTGTNPAVDATNTGLVCQIDAPAFDGTTPSRTKFQYDHFGAKRRVTAPSGVQGPVPSGANAYTEFTYYDNGATDLSGLSSAAGWLKAVKDPYGKFVAFGYDRAGNAVRTWDRNATSAAAQSLDSYPANGVTGYTEEIYGSFASPWRYVTESADALGNWTKYFLDATGNRLRIRPPRGTLAAANGDPNDDTSFDTVQEFNNAGAMTKRITPTGHRDGDKAWRWRYDVYGNQISESDPLADPAFPASRSDDPTGHTKVMLYDGVNRLRTVRWTRTANAAEAAAGCNLTNAPAPLSSSRYYCETTFAYDGHDSQTASTDANRGQPTRFYFDGAGREVRRYVPRSNTLNLQSEKKYDLDGNVVLECSPREFDAAEHVGEVGWSSLTACTTTARFSTSHTYDVAGRRVSMTRHRDTTALTSSFEYNADGIVAAEIAPNTGRTAYTIDLNGRRGVIYVPRAAGQWMTTYVNYDPSGNVTSVVRPGAVPQERKTAYAYDAANRLVEVVEGADSTTASAAGPTSADGGTNIHSGMRYDADGNLVARIDPRAYRDGSGNPSATPPGSSSQTPFMTRYDVDGEGRVVAEYRPRYDGSTAYGDNPVASEQTQHCTTARPQPVLGAANLPSYTSSTAVCVAKRTFDAVGKVTRAELPTSNVVRATPPAAGSEDNRYVTFTYTDDGLLSGITTPDPRVAGARVLARSSVYDGVGRPVNVSLAEPTPGALRHETKSVYSSDGLVLQQTDGVDANVTTYTYDHNGNRKSRANAKNETTSWAYYSDNRMKSMTNPLQQTTSYSYDLNGNTSDVVPPLLQGTGLTRHSTYSLDNLLLTETTPVTANAATNRRTVLTYDYGGRQKTVANDLVDSAGNVVEAGGSQSFDFYTSDRPWKQTGRDTGTITKTYDAAGFPAVFTNTPATGTAVTTTVTSYLDGLTRTVAQNGRTVSYAYDGTGALTLRTANGKTAQYAHNDAGQTSLVTSNQLATGTQISVGYDSAGRVTSQTNPNGTSVARTYNPDNRLASQVLSNASGAVTSWRYGYDVTGRMEMASRDVVGASCPTETGGTLPATGVHCVYYDAAGRLHDFKDASGDKPIRHDGDGNRTQYGSTTFTYNLDDSMATSGSTTIDYDGAGRVETEGTKRYCYDGFDRLAQLRADGTACTGSLSDGVSYAYDALDRQVSRTETGASAVTPGTTSLFYDGVADLLLGEAGPQNVDVDYLTLGERPVHVLRSGGGGTEQFLTDDGRGNVASATSSTGSLACSLRYDPYGSPIGAQSNSNPCSTGSTVSTVFFGGERRDAVSGNYQLGARTYDPAKASFLTQDVYRGAGSSAAASVGTDPLTMNRYSYVNGDPVNYTDPSGHRPCGAESDCDAPYMAPTWTPPPPPGPGELRLRENQAEFDAALASGKEAPELALSGFPVHLLEEYTGRHDAAVVATAFELQRTLDPGDTMCASFKRGLGIKVPGTVAGFQTCVVKKGGKKLIKVRGGTQLASGFPDVMVIRNNGGNPIYEVYEVKVGSQGAIEAGYKQVDRYVAALTKEGKTAVRGSVIPGVRIMLAPDGSVLRITSRGGGVEAYDAFPTRPPGGIKVPEGVPVTVPVPIPVGVPVVAVPPEAYAPGVLDRILDSIRGTGSSLQQAFEDAVTT